MSTWGVVDEVPVDITRGRVYAEGWQSWSPATWYPVAAAGRRPAQEWEHLMRFRPGTAVAERGIQAEGLLVVDPGDGPARLYSPAGGHEVPSLRADLVGGEVHVTASAPVVCRTDDRGAEAALMSYGDDLRVPLSSPPTVWCSWYRYFEDVTAADVLENVADIRRHDLPVDVVQVDDGWSAGLGEGLVVSDRFGSLPGLVERVRTAGHRAGIWLSPFVVGADTTLARTHPDWLVGPAGRNWGQQLVGLDVTHPGVRDLLRNRLEWLVSLGVDYFKLDFLYAGAVPGRRHDGSDPVVAYRSGLSLVREVVGPGATLVGCGAPLLPSVGLVDAMRVSPDTFHEGGEDGSTGLRGLMPLAARAWQQGRWWVNDPDCVVARASYSRREGWAAEAARLGGLASFSDRVAELDDWGLGTVRRLLASGGSEAPFTLEHVRRAAATAAAEVGG
jgi:alpha-galactosidase